MIICIDFDGTCVSHEYPNIGEDIGAIPVLKRLVNNGHKLVLFTMRCNVDKSIEGNGKELVNINPGNYLNDAVKWFEQNNIPLHGVNVNPDQIRWTSSSKAYGELYIDDAALGIPLIYGPFHRPYVNWIKVEKMLIQKGLI